MNVLVCDEFTKVCPDGTLTGGGLRTAADGIQLWGCGGEVVSFQVVIAAGDRVLENVRIEVEALRGGSGRSIAPASFELHRVGFVRTPAVAYTGWQPARWRPDPLFAFEPFRVDPRDFQPVWINLRIPRDIHGGFRGRIVVEAAGKQTVIVPIRVKVWRFNLPRNHSLVNMFDFALAEKFSGFTTRYGPIDGAGFAPLARFMRYLADHSMNTLFYNGALFGSELIRVRERNGRFTNDLRQALRLLDLFKELKFGFNHWNSPVWPDAGVFATLYPTYRKFGKLGRKMDRDCRFNQCLLDLSTDLHRFLEKEGLSKRSFAYIYDEPHKPWHADHMRMLSRRFKEMCPKARQLAAIGRPEYIEGVLDQDLPIDIIVGHLSHHDPKLRRKILESGREYWWYTSNHPSSHLSFWVDEPTIHHRILYWLTWSHRVPGFGYWNTNVWNYLGYGYDNINAGRRMEWPYSNWNITPNGRYDDGSGDGQLVYPGPDGPIGSIRFEAIRHGYQDHACLTLLEAQFERMNTGQRRNLEGFLTRVRSDIGPLKKCATDPATLRRLRFEVAKRSEMLLA